MAPRTVTRLAEDVGAELVEVRDERVDDFTHHRRKPEGVDPKHELAVVFVDGGRVQTREAAASPGVHGACWQEDKVGRLQAMTSRCHSEDPCPVMPACFRGPILSGSASSQSKESSEKSRQLQSFLDGKSLPEAAVDWVPQPKSRTCVATMRPLEDFRWMVQAEAKRRHFFSAKKKAFVADGSSGNWSLWADHFSEFEPILDFLHAAEYVHGASKALGSETLGGEWASDLWSGRSALVIASLRAALDVRGVGEEKLEEDHEWYRVQRAWTYLSNARGKLDYPRYRREGLPCTSSLVESQIKEYNARLKGSEKFWHESKAEAMLELVSWTLNEEGPTLSAYFDQRPGHPFHQSAQGETKPSTLAA